MAWKKRLQYGFMSSILLLSGCGSVGDLTQVSSFGARSWEVPAAYTYEKISSEDVGEAVTMTQGFVQTNDEGERESVLVIMSISATYFDSAGLRNASTASNTRLLGYDHIDDDTIKIECGEESQTITTSRFSFLRSPLSEEKYYMTQGYFVSLKESVIISLLTEDRKEAKSFLNKMEDVVCS